MKHNKNIKLSIIIPCYNEEGNIELIHNAIENACKDIKDYEMVFVNDGSNDNTLINLKKIFKISNSKIKIINFSRNFGKEPALYAGLCNASGDYVSIIDADMQQNPKILIEMYNFLEENDDYDSVAMFQKKRKEGIVTKFFKNTFYKFIKKIAETEFVNGASDFRMFRKKMAESIISIGEYHRFSKGIFSWVGYNTYYMPYTVEKRATGTSKWSTFKLFKYAFNGILSFSTAPLRISTYMGLITSFASIVYLIVVLMQKFFFEIDVPGYATIVVLILFLGGLQLFCLGISGEYLSRTYMETKKRPIYIAKEIISNYED